jgi:hypothetical protein
MDNGNKDNWKAHCFSTAMYLRAKLMFSTSSALGYGFYILKSLPIGKQLAVAALVPTLVT